MQFRIIERRSKQAAFQNTERIFTLRTATSPGTLELAAELIVQRRQIITLVNDRLRIDRLDNVADLDVVEVGRDQKIRNRLQSYACCEGPGLFSLQIGVAAAANDERLLIGIVVPRRTTGRSTICGTGRRPLAKVISRTRIDKPRSEVLRLGRIKLGQVRRANRNIVGSAEAELRDRLIDTSCVVGPNRTRPTLIVRDTSRSTNRQFLDEGNIFEQRQLNFREAFFHFKGWRCQRGNRVVEIVSVRNTRILVITRRFTTIFAAEGETDWAARQIEEAAGIAVNRRGKVELRDLTVGSRGVQQVVFCRL
ncbi:hypothetical protein D9M73_157010 [compost metagenome]